MNIYGIIGVVMVSLPFAGLFYLLMRDRGFRLAFGAFLLVGFLFAWLGIGVYLMKLAGWSK